MDKISKALDKLTTKERGIVRQIIQRIMAGRFAGLNILIAIERRSDNTYKNL